MRRPKKLKLIGYWNDKYQGGSPTIEDKSSDEYARYPSPLDLVSPGWLGSEESDLVSYLRSGIKILGYCGYSSCRFSCEDPFVGTAELTDGVWIWPEGLEHYVEVHDVRLPSEFVDHARKNAFRISKDRVVIYEKYYKNPNLILRIYRRITERITGKSFHWEADLYWRGIDRSFWIEWGKRISVK